MARPKPRTAAQSQRRQLSLLTTQIKAAEAQVHTRPQLSHPPAQANHRAQDQRQDLTSFATRAGCGMLTPAQPNTTGRSYLNLSHPGEDRNHSTRGKATVTTLQRPHHPHNVPPTSPPTPHKAHSHPTPTCPPCLQPGTPQPLSHSPFIATPAQLGIPAQVLAGFGEGLLCPSPAQPAAGPLGARPCEVSGEGATYAMGRR